MNATDTSSTHQDPDDQLAEVVEAYLADLEAGKRPNAQEIIALHPHLGEQLRDCLASLRFVQSTANEIPAPAETPREFSASQLGQLGEFRILRELGRGGMGIVYEAEQMSLSRLIALKVLPFAAMLDRRQLERFKNEARAAATLHHAHIVPVFSVGCEHGVYFYAMQLIEGCSLQQLLVELRRPTTDARHDEADLSGDANSTSRRKIISDDSTRRGMQALVSTRRSGDSSAYIRKVVRLGVQAAEALEYAHSQGIIHRDVKPGNLLLDVDQNIWITDFGLAHLESEASATLSGDVVGTLRYMSPEQASGRHALLDQRTDIYSLGATLYELLTLRPLVPGDTREQLLKRILHEDPTRIRKLDGSIPFDLETILLKAVQKDPADRYFIPQQLADDLQSFLDNKTISARRPSLVGRATRWSRRHIAMITAIVVTLLLSLSLSTVFLFRAWSESEANWQLARRSVDDMYTQVAEEWLRDQPHMTQLQKAFLLKAAAFYDSAPPYKAGDPEVRRDRSEASFRAGRIFGALGDHEKAVAQLEASLAGYRQLVRDGLHDRRDTLGVANCLYWLGHLRGSKGDTDEQRPLIEQALSTVTDVVADKRADPKALRLMAECHLVLSGLDSELAVTHSRQAVELSQRLARDVPNEPRHRETQVRALGRLASLSQADDNALELNSRALEIAQQLVTGHPHTARYQRALAFCYRNRGELLAIRQLDEAAPPKQQGIAVREQMIRNFPDVQYFRNELAANYRDLAATWRWLERLDEADRAKQRSLELEQELVNDAPENLRFRHNLALSLRQHAEMLRFVGRREEALGELAQSISEARALIDLKGSSGQGLLHGALFERMIGQLELNDYAAAAGTLDELIRRGPEESALYRNRGRCWQAAGKYELAQQDFEKALSLDPTHPTTHIHLGLLDLHQLRNESAVEQFTAAIKALQARPPDNRDTYRQDLSACFRHRGIALGRLNRHAEARQDFRSILAECGGGNGGCFQAGAALCRLGEYPLALETLRESLQTEEFYHRNRCPSVCLTWGSQGKLERARESYNGIVGESAVYLALTYARVGKMDEAQYWYDKATELATTRGFFKRKGIWKLDIPTAGAEVEQLLGRPWLVSPADNAPTDFDTSVGRVVIGSSPSRFRIQMPSSSAQDESPPLGSYQVELRCDEKVLSPNEYSLECDAASQLISVTPNSERFDEGVYRISIAAGDAQGQPSVFEVVVLANDLGPRQLDFDVTQNGDESVQTQKSLPMVELIPTGATWTCLADGTDPGTAWREADFDDSTWKTLRLQPRDGDELAANGPRLDDRPKPPTTYFRHSFQLEELADIHLLQLDLRCSDGVAVYLNGQRIVLENLAWDANFQTLAVRRHLREGVGSKFIHPTMLRVGQNCLAVEVHRRTPFATDLDFDLRLSVPRLETVHCELPLGDGEQKVPVRSAILRAKLCLPRCAATSNLRRLRLESALAEKAFNLSWMHEEPLQWGHDRGSTEIVFDVTDSVQAWCDGADNQGWNLLPGDEVDALDWIDQAELKVWFVPPDDLSRLASRLATTTGIETGASARRLNSSAE